MCDSFYFLIFMFVDQLLLMDVVSQLYYLTHARKQQLRSSDLSQLFSLSIFTDFRYQSIKIT